MPTFLRYLVVGSANTILGFAVIAFCYSMLGYSAIAANAVGYGVGFVASFLLNRAYTFRSKVSAGKGLAKFVLVAIAGYGVNLLVLIVVNNLLGFDVYISQMAGILSYLGVVFVASKVFVFDDVARDAGGRI